MVAKTIKNVGLFCGSRKGARPEFIQTARDFGTWLGKSGFRLVYGGGSVGLMGVAADAALEAGGEVLGIITDRLMGMEVGHMGITEMRITDSMSSRKCDLIAASDVFVILPGGLGTFDELFEVLTLRQLGYHDKMTYIVNTENHYGPLIEMIKHTAKEGFMNEDNLFFFKEVSGIQALSQEIST